MQTCAGNTGSLTTGVVTSGTIAGNGAGVPIAFVGGDTNSELDWGVGGIPNTFTVCSVTRYSGANKNRVLTGYSSATANKFGVIDWLQGHVYGMTGVFYSTDTWHGRENLLSPTTEWVVACWRNLAVSGKIITTINGNTISTVAGGKAPIALGINKIPAEKSDWQFSKLYIWNYHLSDVDFALASSSLYSDLSTNNTAGVCRACPPNSRSPNGSVSITECECDAGYTGENGGLCTKCPDGTYKLESGSHACKCNADSYSIDELKDLLLREKPFIVSDAADWNTETQRFDSKCGVQTCAGNTGAQSAGTVTTGIASGNGASAPVTFVGGTTSTKMQWGAGSIPNKFTICSVTRYSGSSKGRILTCAANPSGDSNWLHGHWSGQAGSLNYGSNSYSFSIHVESDWLVMCALTISDTNRDAIIVNNIVKAKGMGGIGDCALGINHGGPLHVVRQEEWERRLSLVIIR